MLFSDYYLLATVLQESPVSKTNSVLSEVAVHVPRTYTVLVSYTIQNTYTQNGGG